MKAIKQYDEYISEIRSGKHGYKWTDVDNADLFEAYWTSKDNGNSEIDFNDVLWEDRIPSLVDAMLAHGVERFTVSTGQSNVQSVITAIMDSGNGAYIDGMKMVYTGLTDFDGNPKMAPAFFMTLVYPEKF